LLHGLLPTEKAGDYAFYAYSPAKGQLAMRTERVVPRLDGGFRLISRPTLDQQEQMSNYDKNERLLERTLSTGQVILPTTEKQLTAIWKLKDR